MLRDSQTRSILTSESIGPGAAQVLRLQRLDDLAVTDPEAAIRALEGNSNGVAGLPVSNALSELALKTARDVAAEDRTRALGLYLDAAFHAYRVTTDVLQLEEPSAQLFDPEVGRAVDLYGAALAGVLSLSPWAEEPGPGGLDFRGPTRSYRLRWDLPADWPWMPSAFEFRPTAFLAVRGLTNHFRAPGLGAPVVAVRRGMPRLPGAAGNVFPTYERFYPLTALVVFEEHAESVEAMLRLTDPLAGSGIELAERRVPVAADYSASLAVAVGDTDIGGIGEGGMFWPGSHLQQTGLYLLEPFRQDKIPVVFIHGLGATPWTWLEMVNDLRGDREIRRNYQFWFFNYPTGLSFAVSAMLCRRALDQAQELYDPDGGIPSMGRIVLIGHSMGGLISRLLVTDDTSGIWNAYFTRPIEQLLLDPSDADLVREAFLGGAVPYVDRVVFLATPHRGSPFADNVIGRTGAAIARLPDDLREMTQRILDANADALAPEVSTSRRGEKGIESTSPESPLIRGLSGTVVAPGITYHSILGDRGKGDGDRSSDGIVPYWSAHLEGAATEITVPSNHIVQDDPAAIEEVRRILLLHLAPATPVGR